jgi:tetratricopeptide (TPR) repeat protein
MSLASGRQATKLTGKGDVMAGLTPMLDAQLRRAVELHQARRLAEAEKAYRELLAWCPDLAEVHVNCALAQLGLGKYREAESSLRLALDKDPGLAKAHSRLGDVLCFQNRYRDAVQSYERALALKPGIPEVLNNMGNALKLLGEVERAASCYRQAVKLRPGFGQAYNNLGLCLLEQNRTADAQSAFHQAVAAAPDYAEAYNNLGNALRRENSGQEAKQAFETAIRLSPAYADAHLNLSAYLFDARQFAEAEASARRAVQLEPSLPDTHNALGNALRERGRLAESESEYREALRLAPDYAEGYKHLAMALEEQGRLDEAFSLFGHYAQLVRDAEPAPRSEPPHKHRHDEEQRAWLGENAGEFHLGDDSRIPGPAVNPANRIGEISALWQSTVPQIVVIDELLTKEALGKLRRFCLDSTVWRQVYDGGYLGAFPEHGFAPALLAQIAEELRATYPAIIEDHPLLHFWAFKYDSSLRGIRKHADFAAVNVNFWVTPDEANLDPEHGGLVVWDKAAPQDWDFARYNAAEDEICAFLKAQESKPVTIPYRANRAVIFDSDLFHETDVIRFKPGYENRRINVTLLFGRRHAHTGNGHRG